MPGKHHVLRKTAASKNRKTKYSDLNWNRSLNELTIFYDIASMTGKRHFAQRRASTPAEFRHVRKSNRGNTTFTGSRTPHREAYSASRTPHPGAHTQPRCVVMFAPSRQKRERCGAVRMWIYICVYMSYLSPSFPLPVIFSFICAVYQFLLCFTTVPLIVLLIAIFKIAEL